LLHGKHLESHAEEEEEDEEEEEEEEVGFDKIMQKM